MSQGIREVGASDQNGIGLNNKFIRAFEKEGRKAREGEPKFLSPSNACQER